MKEEPRDHGGEAAALEGELVGLDDAAATPRPVAGGRWRGRRPGLPPRMPATAVAAVAVEDPAGAFPGRALLAGEAGPEAGRGHRRRRRLAGALPWSWSRRGRAARVASSSPRPSEPGVEPAERPGVRPGCSRESAAAARHSARAGHRRAVRDGGAGRRAGGDGGGPLERRARPPRRPPLHHRGPESPWQTRRPPPAGTTSPARAGEGELVRLPSPDPPPWSRTSLWLANGHARPAAVRLPTDGWPGVAVHPSPPKRSG